MLVDGVDLFLMILRSKSQKLSARTELTKIHITTAK